MIAELSFSKLYSAGQPLEEVRGQPYLRCHDSGDMGWQDNRKSLLKGVPSIESCPSLAAIPPRHHNDLPRRDQEKCCFNRENETDRGADVEHVHANKHDLGNDQPQEDPADQALQTIGRPRALCLS